MSIKTGRYGMVLWDPTGGTAPVQIVSLNKWKADFKQEYEDVSCFGDPNRVYIPGLMDISGSFDGFWNSVELALFKAAMSPTPGTLRLVPNTTESAFFWQGLAYMDAAIDCSMQAPKITGTFKAAGAWTVPGGVMATTATPGVDGNWLPPGSTPPPDGSYMITHNVAAQPATAWTSGQAARPADGEHVYWNGTQWVAGTAP